jgi:hypothetical protein
MLTQKYIVILIDLRFFAKVLNLFDEWQYLINLLRLSYLRGLLKNRNQGLTIVERNIFYMEFLRGEAALIHLYLSFIR